MSKSLSSRRAWIEIARLDSIEKELASRSPHGERGLKCNIIRFSTKTIVSLSSRRAWIEMTIIIPSPFRKIVALLTESVD